ncbi:hypothetical protein ACFWGC_23785 [Cytobacillus pseudoceanisediminis]|uniref:hypothetical protein n=1 Tax=Cytobacillus pseudoceanisediminis TaxID=3051614 RepID=UPI00365BAE21
MKLKKLAVAGITATTLLLNPLAPYLGDSQVAEAAVATLYPKEIPVTFEKGQTEAGGGFSVPIGAKTGTLIFKVYAGKGNTQFANNVNYVKKGSSIPFYFTSGKDVFTYDSISGFHPVSNSTYPNFYPLLGEDTRGTFIGGVAYLPKVYDGDGKYFFTAPNAGEEGYYGVRAFFYEGVNIKQQVINEIDRYFPLLGKVWWDGVELKVGQIGRLSVLKDTPLYKLDGENKIFSRTLKAGEDYRIYAFKPGKLSVGGGYFIDRDERIKYETPSKSKLQLVQMRQ